MDEIQSRLQETSQNCLEAHTEWVGQKKDSKAQEKLNAAIHELRKVSSRLEIELALSERDQMTSKPLPIPSHRANTKKSGGKPTKKGGDTASEASGNAAAAPEGSGGPVVEQKRRPRRKPEGGAPKASEA